MVFRKYSHKSASLDLSLRDDCKLGTSCLVLNILIKELIIECDLGRSATDDTGTSCFEFWMRIEIIHFCEILFRRPYGN